MGVFREMNIKFPEKISSHFASKFIEENCPLKKQVLFSKKEDEIAEGFEEDPVGDSDAKIGTGILQKYNGRLLVLASDVCAMNCRFCFRRNLQQKIFEKFPKNIFTDIKEVILSGGDPLMLNDKKLLSIINAVPKNIRIRIHSRMPVAMPNRFTPKLWEIFKELNSRLIFVCHTNHPNELDKYSEKIFEKMSKHGITILNQSVLLKGINDDAKILAELSEKLFSQKVLPYYLHNLDKAQGTAHFEVEIKKAKKIFNELKELLPGYLVPRFVKETKNKKSKVWIYP